MIEAPQEYKQDSHCSYCGSKFTEQEKWPRKCFICWNESYKNPIPIVVTIVGVSNPAAQCGWLIEKRGIEPQKGGWALPSGYIDHGESWQEAAVRELQEEVGLTTNVKDFELFDIVKPPSGNMLIFCVHKGLVKREAINFAPNHEVEALAFPILPTHLHLCFPSHNEMWNKYYDSVI